ncbi:MAG: 4-alpha-glucanotransferase [Oscillospiraceae bacterium]|nr:4-alpha-glucanotransferase [Oscillospiraceae bacterium]
MRESGILMHISSLPGPYGIGTMGKNAYKFVDFLKNAGQKVWQILPLSPTGFGNSPYQSCSAFAGNHYLIDPESLIEKGLLEKQEAESFFWGNDDKKVDYGALYENRGKMLRLAYSRFEKNEEYEEFVRKNDYWLSEYSLFAAIKESFGGKPWTEWPRELRLRDKKALEEKAAELKDEISFIYFLQFEFFSQWEKLRSYANENGIKIIGDIPIYVPLDSADVWAEPEQFLLDEDCKPLRVAGCPPDSFSADGQLWGNPIYNWEKMKESGFAWWKRRLGAAKYMYDIVRFDHFRGFESYWSIPAEDDTAMNGRWEKGPGMDFINAIKTALPEIDFIAEDLGFVTPEVRKLQEDSGYPGMKVMQFAFDSREEGNYLPHTYPENSVVYSGTHDNPTLEQWLLDVAKEDLAEGKAYLGLTEEEGFAEGLIRGSMASNSRLCVIQMQDYLGLGEEARMNTPGILSDKNWSWRAEPGFDSEELGKHILELTKRFGRI